MSNKEMKREDKMLAEMIFCQWKVKFFVDCGWEEFSAEAESLEKKIHALWIESGREDAPTFDLGVWAQDQGIEFTYPI